MRISASKIEWGEDATDATVKEVMGECRKFISTINGILSDEREKWSIEFEAQLATHEGKLRPFEEGLEDTIRINRKKANEGTLV